MSGGTLCPRARRPGGHSARETSYPRTPGGTSGLGLMLIVPLVVVCKSRVSDQLSDGLIFGQLFQANERSSAFRSCVTL